MTVRHYSSAAGKMVLQLGVTAVATAMQVDTTTGLPGATPFSLLVDVGLPTEEIVTVTQVSGNTLVVVRGEDGTSAQPHANGAVVRHAITARDLRDSRDHENASAGVHGIAGKVVGTTDTQALTNKNLTSTTNTFPATLATAASLTTHAAATVTHGATGAIVGTTNTQTLTNKTVQGGVATPATAAAVGWTVKGAVNQTADLQRWTDSANAAVALVDKDGSYVNTQSTSAGAILNSATSTPTGSYWHFLGSGAVDKNVLNLNAPTGVTAKILSARVNGVEVAGISATGGLSGSTGTFSGAVTAPNLPASSTGKAGKRMHWGSATVNQSAGGSATITHGAGFTPTCVVITPSIAWMAAVTAKDATTFTIALRDADGGIPTNTVLINYFCGE